jgi:hypothetical protein
VVDLVHIIVACGRFCPYVVDLLVVVLVHIIVACGRSCPYYSCMLVVVLVLDQLHGGSSNQDWAIKQGNDVEQTVHAHGSEGGVGNLH